MMSKESNFGPAQISLVVFAAIAVGLIVWNIFLHRSNLDLQEALAERQQFINEGIRVSRFNTQLVQILATVSAQTEDADIRQLLANHGISFTVNLPQDGEVTDE